MFDSLDLNILNDPDFKEDSVREEIVFPLLKRLGYSATGKFKILRSKTLSQPFIYIGTRKHPVNIIPDYILFSKDKPLLILDAKSPSEDILKKSHIQQAYSYAIHPEIRCDNFALCNGHQLAFFNVEQNNPIFIVSIHDFEERWQEIEKYFSPKYLLQPELRNFAPDFGTKLRRIGVNAKTELLMLGVLLNIYAKINENLYTATANCLFAEKEHGVSYDFNAKQLKTILSCLPGALSEKFSNALHTAPFQAAAELAIEIDLKAHLGEETKGINETFFPLVVDEISGSRFVPESIAEEAEDIPPHIYRLRKSYNIPE